MESNMQDKREPQDAIASERYRVSLALKKGPARRLWMGQQDKVSNLLRRQHVTTAVVDIETLDDPDHAVRIMGHFIVPLGLEKADLIKALEAVLSHSVALIEASSREVEDIANLARYGRI